MIVANPNPPGNPNSSNSAADKEVVLKAHAALLSIVDQLVSNVWDAVAPHATFDQFERSAGKNTGICLSVWNIDRELAQELWLLGELVDGRDPLKSPERTTQCPDWSEVVDKPGERGAVVARQLTLADAGRSEVSEWRIRHPDGAPILGLPRIHIGPLGTGNSLQRDNGIFDRLSVGQRLFRGLDMEASAIGLAGHFEDLEYTIVAKGVMDFAAPISGHGAERGDRRIPATAGTGRAWRVARVHGAQRCEYFVAVPHQCVRGWRAGRAACSVHRSRATGLASRARRSSVGTATARSRRSQPRGPCLASGPVVGGRVRVRPGGRRLPMRLRRRSEGFWG